MNYSFICVKCLCISGSGQPQERGGGGGKWGVSFSLIWPYFVGGHAEAIYRPEGHAVLEGGRGVIFFFFPEGTQMHRGNTGST